MISVTYNRCKGRDEMHKQHHRMTRFLLILLRFRILNTPMSSQRFFAWALSTSCLVGADKHCWSALSARASACGVVYISYHAVVAPTQ